MKMNITVLLALIIQFILMSLSTKNMQMIEDEEEVHCKNT